MHRATHASAAEGSKWPLGILFFLVPSCLAFVWASALKHNVTSVSGTWFLYEVSRLIACVGIAIATAVTLGIAIRRATSTLFLALMMLSTGGAALLLWYTAHIFRSPW